MNHYNILTEPIIRYVGDSPRSGSLPGVLSALMRDEVEAFPGTPTAISATRGTRSWCSLGALAIHNSGSTEDPERSERLVESDSQSYSRLQK